MKIFYSIEEYINLKINVNHYIPTMGNLHDGHMSLIKNSKKNYNKVCLSIFINEKQFNNKKDFSLYPRTLEEDIKKLKKLKVDYLLIPNKKDIENFSSSFDKKLEPKKLTTDLCGKYRPGHFLAVIDIIHRFIQIIQPKKIVLGEKDYQQLIVIKELIKIYNHKVKVVSLQTVRDKDGLALSSRNNLLSIDEKKSASDIYKALLFAKKLFINKVPIDKIYKEMHKFFEKSPIKLQYFAIRNFKLLQCECDNALIAFIACYLGKVRLIDNIILKPSTI